MNQPSDKACRKCSEPLHVGVNWPESRVRAHAYICKPCAAACRVTYRANEKRRTPAHRAANAAKERVRHATYRANNGDKERTRWQAYRAANPGVVCATSARRRARKKLSEVPSTPAQRREVQAVYELAALASQFTGEEFHVDHRLPLSRGGSSLASNLFHLPATLNLAKGDKTHEEALMQVPGYADWVDGPDTYEVGRALRYRHPR